MQQPFILKIVLNSSIFYSYLRDIFVYQCLGWTDTNQTGVIVCFGGEVGPPGFTMVVKGNWIYSLVCQGCHNQLLQTGWLKQQNLIPQSFGSQKSEIKLSGGLISSESSSLWLVNGCLLPGSSHGFPSVTVFVFICSSYKDTSYIGLGLIHMTSFCLNY